MLGNIFLINSEIFGEINDKDAFVFHYLLFTVEQWLVTQPAKQRVVEGIPEEKYCLREEKTED